MAIEEVSGTPPAAADAEYAESSQAGAQEAGTTTEGPKLENYVKSSQVGAQEAGATTDIPQLENVQTVEASETGKALNLNEMHPFASTNAPKRARPGTAEAEQQAQLRELLQAQVPDIVNAVQAAAQERILQLDLEANALDMVITQDASQIVEEFIQGSYDFNTLQQKTNSKMSNTLCQTVNTKCCHQT